MLGQSAGKRQGGTIDNFPIDLTIAIENVVLAAWNLGLERCWIRLSMNGRSKRSLKYPLNCALLLCWPRATLRKDL